MAGSNFFIDSMTDLQVSFVALVRRPLGQLALVVAVVAGWLVAPLWGLVPARMGFWAMRARLASDGVARLGEVLAPTRALEMYRDGVWRGLWRAHGVSLAFLLVQLPVALLTLLPAVVALVLFKPIGTAIGAAAGNFTVGTIVTAVVPVLVAAGTLCIIVGQMLLAHRLLGAQGLPYTLGVVYRVSGTSWRAALRGWAHLATLGVVLAILCTILAALVYGLVRLGVLIGLGYSAADIIVVWVGVLSALMLSCVGLEAVARWSALAEVPEVSAKDAYSFTSWLCAWLGAVFGWLRTQGVLAIGVGLCLVLGLALVVEAIVEKAAYTSYVALGWFAVTAAVVVVLRVTQRDR
jgi:hypothetical protein